MRKTLLILSVVVAFGGTSAWADTIVFGGKITQSTSDGTGPATSNPSLNNIQDGDSYTVTFTFPGSVIPSAVVSPNLVFTDLTNPASESSFSSLSTSIIPDGSDDDFSMLACLTTGDCSTGNQLTANFKIPAALLHSQNVTATGLDEPHPLDLLEDEDTDNPLDIHGTITTYSYTGAAAVPEPAALTPLIIVFGAIAGFATKKKKNQ